MQSFRTPFGDTKAWSCRRPWPYSGLRCHVLVECRILANNVRTQSSNLSNLTVALSQYYIQLCSENLVSDFRHVSEFLVPRYGRRVLLCKDTMPLAHGFAAYVRDGYGVVCQPKF